MRKVKEGLYIEKEEDGRYLITTVSTAAVKDQDGETFTVDAIDWDIAEAKRKGDYPEFRAFHKSYFGIGRVEKMSRVGIFAVDQGHSYTDPFSLEICEKLLARNDGKWRCSRGFYVTEASGNCPSCGSGLVVSKEHMEVGFRCPSCKQVHISYKGVLKELHFRKARTFDVTITDIPCVPYTGASAIKSGVVSEVNEMNKQQLKEKLLANGISEEVIDLRLAGMDESRLKEIDDIPDAVLLKEFEDGSEEEVDDGEFEQEDESSESDDELFTLDPQVLKEFAAISRSIIRGELDGMEIEVDTPSFKEDELAELKEKVDAIYDVLVGSKQKTLKEILGDAPRNGKLRVARFKQQMPPEEEDDEEDDDMDEEDAEEKEVSIVSGDGRRFKSMTEMITAK